AELPDQGLLLAVDDDVGRMDIDMEDVTRVLHDDGRILAIGKEMPRFNAFDTGVFLCTPAVLQALERAFAAGDSSLSGAVRELSSRDRARAVAIAGAYWADVDDEQAFHRGEQGLVARLRGKANDGPVSRHLNRPVSTFLSRHLARTRITPNQ